MLRPGRGLGLVVLAVLLGALPAHASTVAAGWSGDLRSPHSGAVGAQFTDRLLGGGVECYGRTATIVGTEAPDVLQGTSGSDVIAGLGENDTITGGGGQDFICPGDGNDDVNGGPALDNIEASAGDDVLNGGLGRDFLGFFDSPAAAVVNLGAGLASGWGSDQVDDFEGVVGSRFGDRLTGTAGEDQLEGRAGNDVLNGAGDLDLLLPGSGRDRVNGGPGFDYAVYWDSPNPIWASLRRNRARGNGGDRFTSIRGLGGSERADTLIGSDRANGLYGHGGRDRLRGLAGADWLYGGLGRDYLDGGPGADFLHGEAGRDRCVNGERVRSCP